MIKKTKRAFFQQRKPSNFDEIPLKKAYMIIRTKKYDIDKRWYVAQNGRFELADCSGESKPDIFSLNEARDIINKLKDILSDYEYKIVPFKGNILRRYCTSDRYIDFPGATSVEEEGLTLFDGVEDLRYLKPDVIQIRRRRNIKPKPKRCSCKKK